MRETTAWVVAVVLALAIAVGGPVGCTVHQDHAMKQAIERGADPIRTRCAFEYNPGILCVVVAAQPQPAQPQPAQPQPAQPQPAQPQQPAGAPQ